MPGPITAALIAAGLSAGAAAAVIFVGKLLLSLAVSSMLRSLTDDDTQPVDRRTLITGIEPSAPWNIVYGRVRKGGPIVFREARDEVSIYLETDEFEITPGDAASGNAVPAVAPFRSDEGAEFYERVPDGNDGYEYVATPLVRVDTAPTTGQYRVIGSRYEFSVDDVGRYVRRRYKLEGPVESRSLHLVVPLAYGESEAIDELWLNNERVPLDAAGNALGRLAGYVKCNRHLGGAGDAADAELMAALPSYWDANCKLAGHTYIYVRLLRSFNVQVWADGVPNITVVMRGRKVFDPRTGLTVYSENAALCAADYLHDPLGFGADYDTAIGEDDLIAAANICDEAVALAAGGTEPRYIACGVVNTESNPLQNLQSLLGAMAGNAVYSGGAWRLHAGAYRPPVVTITESDLTGPIKITPIQSVSESYAGVKGLYSDEIYNFQPAGFPAVGVAPFKTVQLQFTPTAVRAQRIAKIDLLRGAQQMVVSMPLRLRAYEAEPPDTLALTLPRYGFSSKVFEMTEMTLNFSDSIGLDVLARETDASVWDWASSEEITVDAAPNTTLLNPFVVLPPSVPDVQEVIYDSFAFSVRVKAIVTWAPSPDGQVRRYDLQWRRDDESAWSEHSGLSVLTDEVLSVTDGLYHFRVRAVSQLGVGSVWAQRSITFAGLTAPPADVTGFAVTKSGGFALARCDAAADLDVKTGGALVIRHTPVTSSPLWEMGVILDTFPGTATQGLVPLVTGTYMAKWRDSSDKYSPGTATFEVTEGMLSGLTTVATSTQAPGFTGSKTNITLDGGLGGVRLTAVPGTGEYLFNTHIDLTTVATRRFELDIAALTYADGDTVASRIENISTWSSFTGTLNINACNATVYERHTNDDPSGSPVWSAWAPLMVSEITCRAAQFKLVLDSASSIHNIVVTTLTMHVKE
jgi:hypothetical protein